jgi:heat shock protein HslJ
MLAKRQILPLFLTFIISFTLYANDNNTTRIPPDQNITFSKTYWKLIELNEDNISTAKMSREAHIVFSTTVEGAGRFKGASGCNEMLGKYSGNDNNISIDTQHIAMTRMACPQIEIETQFIQTLGRALFWEINMEYLELMDSNGSHIAKFIADYNKTKMLK